MSGIHFESGRAHRLASLHPDEWIPAAACAEYWIKSSTGLIQCRDDEIGDLVDHLNIVILGLTQNPFRIRLES